MDNRDYGAYTTYAKTLPEAIAELLVWILGHLNHDTYKVGIWKHDEMPFWVARAYYKEVKESNEQQSV